MSPEKASLEELKRTAKNWKQKIDEMQQKAAGGKNDDTVELIKQMKQQQALIEQYLQQLEAEAGKGWDKKVAELDRMFRDVDNTYREAMSYIIS
jgi:hypothetical protein